jgi:hypothetical protein
MITCGTTHRSRFKWAVQVLFNTKSPHSNEGFLLYVNENQLLGDQFKFDLG